MTRCTYGSTIPAVASAPAVASSLGARLCVNSSSASGPSRSVPRRQRQSDRTFTGALDEQRCLYNRPLSGTEITTDRDTPAS
jgi:hypothetical protein